jgi:glycosyltransferase involved in cell wall biosynthesis
MNVLIVSQGGVFPPRSGAAVKVFNTAKYLSRLGDEVWFVSEGTQYHIFSRGEVHEANYPSWLGRVPFWEREAGAVLKRLGVPRNEINFYDPLLNTNLWARAVWAARSCRPDVIQAEFPTFVLAAWIAKTSLFPARPPLILVEHNVEFLRIAEFEKLDPKSHRSLERIERAMTALSDRVVAVSEIDRGRLVAARVPSRKVMMIPLGVDLENYEVPEGDSARQELGIPRDAFVLVFHGTLNYGPNRLAALYLTQRVLPALERQGKTVWLLLIGVNPPKECEGLRVVKPGPVDTLPRFLAAADLAVVPIEHGGGTRLKILEYFAAGLPVLSTPKGAEGIPVESGREVVIAPLNDFAQMVGALVDDPGKRQRIGEMGREFVRRYDWIEICRQYQRLYQECAHQARA